MAEEKKVAATEDKFALTVPSGAPAYPQMVYAETDQKHPNGSPIMKELGIAKNPEEHKAMLAEYKSPKGWDHK
jgi:hypothetical protein